jgi:hypothetical protein
MSQLPSPNAPILYAAESSLGAGMFVGHLWVNGGNVEVSSVVNLKNLCRLYKTLVIRLLE